jgi:hypothetical protein
VLDIIDRKEPAPPETVQIEKDSKVTSMRNTAYDTCLTRDQQVLPPSSPSFPYPIGGRRQAKSAWMMAVAGLSCCPEIPRVGSTLVGAMALRSLGSKAVSPGAGAAKIAAWAAMGGPLRRRDHAMVARRRKLAPTSRRDGPATQAAELGSRGGVPRCWCYQGCRMGGAGQTCCNNEPMQWWRDQRRNLASASWRGSHADYASELGSRGDGLGC